MDLGSLAAFHSLNNGTEILVVFLEDLFFSGKKLIKIAMDIVIDWDARRPFVIQQLFNHLKIVIFINPWSLPGIASSGEAGGHLIGLISA